METTLIITTFNDPKALSRVFHSVARQSHIPEQIVIADDGSSEETTSLVRDWMVKLHIVHIWQSDQNFRASRARNLAALRALGQHLLFIDGDCVLPKHFVRSHRNLVDESVLVSGGRFLLNPLESEIAKHNVNLDVARFDFFSKWKLWRLPLGPLRDFGNKNWRKVRTCNVGMMRDDFFNVGGFDERYVGWGREDSDLVVRLLKSGAKIRSGRFAATVKHLNHRKSPRCQLSQNETLFNETLNQGDIIYSKQTILSSI